MKGIEEYIALDPTSPSGLCWKKVPLRARVKQGQPALASLRSGIYYVGKFKQQNLFAHRVVYYLATGIDAPEVVDHIDGDTTNNLPSNLRAASVAENAHNNRKCKGYCWRADRGHWKAQIRVAGKEIHLGSFHKEEDAREAYLKAKAKYHPTTPVDLLTI